ncbi:hypothetical protein [Psychroflexus sediminis]|uniref:hypothetical protein n=1 Tax=Psychroflexus sediminis TaxID=470826 RepID=UPI00115F8306|nr:hypothetical protein [Psychroflexus sediminis]
MKRLILFILFSVLSVATAFAQAGDPPPPPGPVDDLPTPIDDHLWMIFLVGLVFGLYVTFTKKSILRD